MNHLTVQFFIKLTMTTIVYLSYNYINEIIFDNKNSMMH